MSFSALNIKSLHKLKMESYYNMHKLIITFSLLIAALFSAAQNNFRVEVKDANGKAVFAATVAFNQQSIGLTDGAGIFTFHSDSSNVSLTVTHAGFSPAMVNAQRDIVVMIILKNNSDQLPEALVYAFNSITSAKNTAAAVSLLDNSAIEKFGNSSFVQAVNTVPGVKMDERSPGSYRLSIRGNLLRSAFGVRNVKLYRNGLPFTDASGNTYLNAIAPAMIDQAEIIKGPAGSMYGAGTGGVILLRNENPVTKKKKAVVQLSGGSYGSFSGNGFYATGNEKTYSKINVAHQQADGYRAQSAMRRDNAQYDFAVKTNAHTIKAMLFLSDLVYQTPGGLTLAEMKANPKQARPRAGASPGAAEQKATIRLKLLYSSISDEIKINERWKNTTGIYFSADRQDNPAIRNYEEKKESGTGGRTVFQYKAARIDVSGGAEFQYSHVNTATYGNRKGVRDTLQYHDLIDVRQVNVFVQSAFELPVNFLITAGISYNNFYYGFERKNIPLSKDAAGFPAQVIPRLTLLKKIKTIASVYASYSKGYSPPSIDEIHATDGIFNKSLNAERSTNYEAGAKASFFKNRIDAAAAYYVLRLDNTIVTRKDAAGADFYVNAGSTDQKGFELAIDYHSLPKATGFIRKTNAYISATKSNANFKNYKQGTVNFSGNRLTGSPYSTFSAGVDAESRSGIYAAASVTYTDKIPLNDANTFYEDPYTLLFSKLGFKTKIKHCTADFFTTLQKSFDDIYSLGDDLNAAGNRFYNPSAKVIFSAGMKLGF